MKGVGGVKKWVDNWNNVIIIQKNRSSFAHSVSTALSKYLMITDCMFPSKTDVLPVIITSQRFIRQRDFAVTPHVSSLKQWTSALGAREARQSRANVKINTKTTRQTTRLREPLFKNFYSEFRKRAACTQFLWWSGVIIKLSLQMKRKKPNHTSHNSNPLSSTGWLNLIN